MVEMTRDEIGKYASMRRNQEMRGTWDGHNGRHAAPVLHEPGTSTTVGPCPKFSL
jgi:hypothetical protein